MGLVECVPNFSEGRRPEVVETIVAAIAGVRGATVLGSSSDTSHNRTVVTFVADSGVVVEAALAGIAKAAELIDLTSHTGQHPRIGATDVCPFVPLEGSTIEECVELARELGRRVGDELGIPVFLYERAASRADRVNLADVRRGEFEGARDAIGTDPDREPDFGPSAIHPTAGATVIGARPFLVAYNVYLGGAENLPVAKEVAKAVRESSGGLPAVKALGLEVEGQAQVSMNLVDTDRTPLAVAYDAVAAEARRRGVEPTGSEIVGLVPEAVLLDTAVRCVGLRSFSSDDVLENAVQAAAKELSMRGFVDAVRGSDPVPGGGSVSALAGQLAAALAEMVAGLTIGRPKYAAVEEEMRALASDADALVGRLGALVDDDADAYALVSAAYRLPKDDPTRSDAVRSALLAAAEVPLETARACRDAARLAVVCAEHGNRNTVTDAGVAALLADAGCRGAAYNVRINVVALDDRTAGEHLVRDAADVVRDTQELAARAVALVEDALD